MERKIKHNTIDKSVVIDYDVLNNKKEKIMKTERKVYNGWLFTENELEKGNMNFAIYQELVNKYNVLFGTPRNEDDFDVVVQRQRGHNHSVYTVIKNKPNLSDDELMLICDGGILCFGGEKIAHNRYRVNED